MLKVNGIAPIAMPLGHAGPGSIPAIDPLI
jgi:hypothetical protein